MKTPHTILVVDDDCDLRSGLKTVLQARGFRTLEADDGMAARHLIDGQRPDLVILDLMMPRWDGFMLLEHFQGKTDAPPFIMITASDGHKSKAYAEQAGVVDFIRKPFSMERLLEGVGKVLGKPVETNEDKPTEPQAPAEPLSLICRCSGCGARIKAPLRLRGQTRTCPGCQQPFVVRAQPPEDEGPKLVSDQVGDESSGRPRSGLFDSR
ncbi:MAG: response regulator [Gemmataceae bacterium]|nr:response regulator [Gemmataceae bacterium]